MIAYHVTHIANQVRRMRTMTASSSNSKSSPTTPTSRAPAARWTRRSNHRRPGSNRATSSRARRASWSSASPARAPDDRRATYGRTGVRKRRRGPMRTLALRQCARVLRRKPRHGHVLRLRGQTGQRRRGRSGGGGSDPPVRGLGAGAGPCAFSHAGPRPPGVAPDPGIPWREGAVAQRSGPASGPQLMACAGP